MVPAASVAEWDQVELADATQLVTLSNAQSLFYYLKYGDQFFEAAKDDVRRREEVSRLRA